MVIEKFYWDIKDIRVDRDYTIPGGLEDVTITIKPRFVVRNGGILSMSIGGPSSIAQLEKELTDRLNTHDAINMVAPTTAVPTIKNVIFNDPATIVFWSDDTKTVVKCSEDDEFDAEKGLSMAIAKKFKYYDQMKPHLKKYEENSKKELDEFDKLIDECTLSMKTVDHRWTEFIKAINKTPKGIKEDTDDKKTDIPSNP